MKTLMIVAIIVLLIALLLPYQRLGINEKPAKIVRYAAAAFMVAVSVAYFASSF
jgi:hypothetical protein